MKKLLIVLMVLFLAANCFALELVRQKNVATVITFPLIDSTTTTALQSGATAPDSEFEEWTDGTAPAGGFTDCANEISEIGTTGIYSLSLANTEVDSDYTVIQIKASDALTQIILIRTVVGDPQNLATTTAGGLAALASGVDMTSISGDSAAADNLEATYDGTGYGDDVAPATQVQVATLAGGIALRTAATGINIDEPNGGEQTQTYAATTTHDGSYHEVASDDAGNDIDFYYTFNTGDGDNLPVDFHFVGYYEDNNAPANSTMVIQVYDFSAVTWVTLVTLTDSSADLILDLPLNVHDVDPSGGTEGEVRIRFNLTTPEVTQNVRIDYATVGYVSGGGGLTAAAVVNEWETQSQADPTGFHINILEWLGTGVNADTAGYPVVTVKDGTGTGELDTSSGTVLLRSATETQIDNIDTATAAYDTDAEYATAIWNAATNAYGGAGTYGQAVEDILADTSAIDTSAEWLSLLSAVDTDATSATHAPAYVTLEAGKASDDAYNGMSVSVTDATDGNTETRRIEDYTSGRKVTFDRALSFTPVQDDLVRIYAMPYNITAAIAGGSANTYIVTDSGDAGGTPIADVSVWITADSAGARLVVSGVTDSNGEVIFYLDAGTTYYVWMAKSGYSFSDNGESWLAE